MGDDSLDREQLKLLTEVSHFVAETANVSPYPHQPYVGTSAFAHKGGVHASAAARLPEAYEHIDPAAVGNLARFVVSELAGKASLTLKAEEMGIDLGGDAETVSKVLDGIKELEYRGYTFEAATRPSRSCSARRSAPTSRSSASNRSGSSPRSARTDAS